MTERRKRRKREEEDEVEEDVELNDEQTEIAKYLRFNCPTKSSTFQNDKVQYFKGSKAIECLLDSKWASGKKGSEVLFTDRESVQEYLQDFLELGLFKRIVRVRKKKKGEKDDDKKSKGAKEKKDSAETSTETDAKKKKVKIKIEIHDNQVFLDGDEVYMWVFDPIHPRTIFYGVLVVIGAIILCLFPLWPMQMREYVWYLSVGAAILLGALIVVACLSYVIFAVVWVLTAGRHHFWLFPNLLEENGVLESFVPLYTLTSYTKDSKDKGDDKDNKDNGDNKDDDNKDEDKKDNEDKKNNEDTKDNEDKKDNEGTNKDNERNKDATNDGDSRNKSKDASSEGEPWIQVTPEDIAQAKEATEPDNDDDIITDEPAEC